MSKLCAVVYLTGGTITSTYSQGLAIQPMGVPALQTRKASHPIVLQNKRIMRVRVHASVR